MLGCQNKQPQSPPPPSPPVAATPPVVVTPPDAAVVAKAPVKVIEQKGQGACAADADCELSSWQPGCCTSACEEYAIAKKDLAAKKAKEKCNDDEPCPPPSPCPEPTWMADSAVCRQGTCTAVGHAVEL